MTGEGRTDVHVLQIVARFTLTLLHRLATSTRYYVTYWRDVCVRRSRLTMIKRSRRAATPSALSHCFFWPIGTVPSKKLAEICRDCEANFTSVMFNFLLNVRREGIKRLIGHQFRFAEINSSVVLSEFYVRGTISYSQRGLIFDGVDSWKNQVHRVICRGNFFHFGWRKSSAGLYIYICIEEHETW